MVSLTMFTKDICVIAKGHFGQFPELMPVRSVHCQQDIELNKTKQKEENFLTQVTCKLCRTEMKLVFFLCVS